MVNAIFLVNKEVGPTSRDIVNVLNKTLGTKKLGHAGSLDPFASGLLIIGMNQGLKLVPYIELLPKTYIASLKLGIKTSTGDSEGEILERANIPSLEKEQVEKVLQSFLGDVEQIPPMYSALKHDGVPLYQYARKGVEIERKPRIVQIFDIKLLSIEKDNIIFLVECSKGTYVRTLGEDIATKLGTIGYLEHLMRTKIGEFNVKDAKLVGDISLKDAIRIEDATYFIPSITVKGDEEKKAKNGMKMHFKCNFKQVRILSSVTGELIAIYELGSDGVYYSKRGFYESN